MEFIKRKADNRGSELDIYTISIVESYSRITKSPFNFCIPKSIIFTLDKARYIFKIINVYHYPILKLRFDSFNNFR